MRIPRSSSEEAGCARATHSGADDYAMGFAEIVEPGTRVLDLGCGEVVLAWLHDHKQVRGRGVEIDASKVRRAIAPGVSVFQGQHGSQLWRIIRTAAFDYVILSQTLQGMRPYAFSSSYLHHEMFPRWRSRIVAFPFGHWTTRLSLNKQPLHRARHCFPTTGTNRRICTS